MKEIMPEAVEGVVEHARRKTENYYNMRNLIQVMLETIFPNPENGNEEIKRVHAQSVKIVKGVLAEFSAIEAEEQKIGEYMKKSSGLADGESVTIVRGQNETH